MLWLRFVQGARCVNDSVFIKLLGVIGEDMNTLLYVDTSVKWIGAVWAARNLTVRVLFIISSLIFCTKLMR